MRPVHVLGDGNCCPRSASLLFTGSDDRHTEMRVRIVRELLLHDDRYPDSSFLCQGIDRVDTTLPAVYAQYSPGYVPGSKLSDADIRNVYERETMSVVRSGAYCGIWQLHALESVVNWPIRSIYPGIGPQKADLCRMLLPRQQPGVADYHGYVMKAAILLMGRRGVDLPFFFWFSKLGKNVNFMLQPC